MVGPKNPGSQIPLGKSRKPLSNSNQQNVGWGVEFLAAVRVRGIYSTALIKLLLDQGFQIVQASRTQQERFGFENNADSPDLDINDLNDLQGVSALGKSETLAAFISILQGQLDDVIIRSWPVTVDGIYKGVVKENNPATQTALVDIGSATGMIKGSNLPRTGDQMVVQVERHFLGARVPALTTEIKIPGRYAVLLPGRQVRISKRIFDWNARTRLQKLGEQLATGEWGILWRTSAANTSDSELKLEVAYLSTSGQKILEKVKATEAPALLWEGLCFAGAEFPALSKKKLDDVRMAVKATIPGHHFYKACGQRVSVALDMAERMLEKGMAQNDVEELFKQTVEQEYPNSGDMIEMEHVKLDGKVLHLGPASLESYSSETSTFELRRVFRREGIYDGLAVQKELGDYAVTKAGVGDWHFKTQYFSKDGELKGSYINLNTPIELYPYGIRYVDLEVDVCVWRDGRLEVLDFEKLEEALRNNAVTEQLVKIVKTRLGELVEAIRSNMRPE